MAEPGARRVSGFGRVATAVLVLVLVAAGGGVAAGAALVPAAPPDAIGATVGPREVPVRVVPFDGAEPASLTIVRAEAGALRSQAAGRVTSTGCAPGSEFVSGATIASVNDRPLLLLATARPLWRDLAVGDTGEDVRALQEELHRLGMPGDVDGRFGRTTLTAVRSLARAAGIPVVEWSTLHAEQVVWSPEPTVRVASCPARVGDGIVQGGTIATLPAGIASARLTAAPAGADATPHVVRVDGEVIPLDADGRVGSKDGLAALAATPSVRAAAERAPGSADTAGGSGSGAASGDSFTVDGEWALAMPLDALVVPPAALYRVAGDHACVLAAGSARRVRILGSQLGKTFIEKPDREVPTRVALRPVGAPPCR